MGEYLFANIVQTNLISCLDVLGYSKVQSANIVETLYISGCPTAISASKQVIACMC